MGNRIKLYRKILQLSVVRLMEGIIACLVSFSAVQLISSKLLSYLDINGNVRDFISSVLAVSVLVSVYNWVFKRIDNREVTECSTKRMGHHLVWGCIIGSSLYVLVFFFAVAKGGAAILYMNRIFSVLPSVTVALTTAFVSEFILRGILFRYLENRIGSYNTLLLYAAIYGFCNILNPAGNLISVLAVALQLGLLYSLSFMYFRNLWYPIALHFSWEFVKNGIFASGANGVSVGKSLFYTSIKVNRWYTGCGLGMDTSVQALVLLFVVCGLFLMLCKSEGRIIKIKNPSAR